MIFKYVSLAIGVSFVLFWITRQFARPAPKTMNAQYQEMTNEYLRVRQIPLVLQSGRLRPLTLSCPCWLTFSL